MTVLRHFGLREQPFGVTPDPRFLYATYTHREALASILYGLESGLGFVSLIAQPGMGKTTLLFEALRCVAVSTRSVFLFQTISNPQELVHSLLMDLGDKDVSGNLVEMQSRLNQVLVDHQATGRRLVVVIDEAQNMSTAVLEAVRMLSNFETAGQKLLQIVLAGQPQLAEKLVSPELLQLRQRVSIFAHLDPLQDSEVAAYVQHRLRIAGCDLPEPVFTEAALTSISRASEGIPRNINSICFNALSLGYALQKASIDADVIAEVVKDLDVRVDYARPALPALRREESRGEIAAADDDGRPARFSRVGLWALCFAVLGCVVLSLLAGILIGGRTAVSVPAVVRQGLVKLGTSQPKSAPPVTLAPSTGGSSNAATVPPTPGQVPADLGSAQPSDTVTGTPVAPNAEAPPLATPSAAQPGQAEMSSGKGSVVVPQPSVEGPATLPSAGQSTNAGKNATPNNSAPAAETDIVRARSGQTMYSICKEMFQSCSADTLHRMVELNPGIADPNRIMPGQRIVIPALPPS